MAYRYSALRVVFKLIRANPGFSIGLVTAGTEMSRAACIVPALCLPRVADARIVLRLDLRQ